MDSHLVRTMVVVGKELPSAKEDFQRTWEQITRVKKVQTKKDIWTVAAVIRKVQQIILETPLDRLDHNSHITFF